MNTDTDVQKSVEELTEERAKFILIISVIAGHLPKYWLDKAIELSKGVME